MNLISKKDVAKAYGNYAKGFYPRPRYMMNGIRAFVIGGLICTAALWYQNRLITMGISQKEASVYVTITLIAIAQLLTGIGKFDVIAKFAGAGVIVPITGFANSMVATAIEYKREGPVLGAGAKMFTVAGPVLVAGITSAMAVGIIYWALSFYFGL